MRLFIIVTMAFHIISVLLYAITVIGSSSLEQPTMLDLVLRVISSAVIVMWGFSLVKEYDLIEKDVSEQVK